MDPKLANQQARQRKKIEKDRRRKQYDDIQVQGTNNSSIVSKRSVEMIYTSKLDPQAGEWFKFFVKNAKRRSPAINRGYWIRMESIKSMITRIIKMNPTKEICIVNLGCGYDPLPFQLLAEKKHNNVSFLDFDYPDLLERKVSMVKNSPEILSLLGDEIETDKSLGVLFSSDKYKIVACDLKDHKLYAKQLSLLLDDSKVAIFVAEVSLAYMKPEHANPVIELSSKVPNSHFLILEQILPCGEYHLFAKKMLYHFSHLRSPLQCVQTYPTKEHQLSRFKQYFPYAEIQDLFENWLYLVDDEMKRKISTIEPFDEWEEFIVFCQHYVVVHSSNMDQMIYPQNPPLQTLKEDSIKAKMSVRKDIEQMQLKFSASCRYDKNIVVFGGSEQTRTNRFLAVSETGIDELDVKGNIPEARMCHTLTQVKDMAILIGGRGRPGDLYSDCYAFSNDEWRKLDNLQSPRARHSSVRINLTQVLVFGGADKTENAFEILDTCTGKVQKLSIVGEHINFSSSGIAYDESENVGYIVGGVSDHDIPNVRDFIYQFELENDTVRIKKVTHNDAFKRIGCQLHLTLKTLYIIGGASTVKCLGEKDSIIKVDLTSKEIYEVPIEEQFWKDYAPMLIGFSLVPSKDKLTIVGGGAVCYSFGSCYNLITDITF